MTWYDKGEIAKVGAMMELWGCDTAQVQCPCTHLPFLFHQNRSPLVLSLPLLLRRCRLLICGVASCPSPNHRMHIEWIF
jgi:hypothetical protein